MVAVLWFQTSGSSLTMESPDECVRETVPLIRAIAVGLLSALISTVFICLLGLLHQRSWRYCEGWTPCAKRCLLLRWMVMDACMVLGGLLYMAFASLGFGLFLAQVGDADRLTVFVSSATSLAKTWVLQPLIGAFVLSVLAAAVHKEPQWMEDVEKELGLDVNSEGSSHQGNTVATLGKELGLDIHSEGSSDEKGASKGVVGNTVATLGNILEPSSLAGDNPRAGDEVRPATRPLSSQPRGGAICMDMHCCGWT